MNARFLTMFLALAAGPACCAQADAPKPPPPDLLAAPAASPAASPTFSARPSDEAIKAAVRAILEEMPPERAAADGTVLSGGPYREFARQFSEAEKPHCLGPNATRHQPAGFSTKNWNYGFGGLTALPFWAAAILRGKCSWNR